MHPLARTIFFHCLRLGFRLVPMPQRTRDRLRGWFLVRHAQLIPQPARGQLATGAREIRLRRRADSSAIGFRASSLAPIPSPPPATLVAFYLPQFHPIPENDHWWGKGFTEWRNVARALPQFEGHAQPRLPADLGFYDLRDPNTMRAQAALARQYGISAFCSYFYWFGGRTLLEAPLRNWLDDPSINIQLCLCWANESWTRRWDGRNHDILIAQSHSAEDDLAFISHVAAYLRDTRYLRVDGKPLLLVYRPSLLPDALATSRRWRTWCHDNGIGPIHIAYVQGFERPNPRTIGFDAAVEFPPNMSMPPSIVGQQVLINDDYEGDILDWRALSSQAAVRPSIDYLLYPCVNPGWDNEPRRPGRGRIYKHASPRGYRDWLRAIIHERLSGVAPSERLVFINAWNEWAEGAILEPDQRLGHAWLDATRQALQADLARSTTPYAIVHAPPGTDLKQVLSAMQASRMDWKLLITTNPAAEDMIRSALDEARTDAEVHAFDPREGDLLPFLYLADRLIDLEADFALKLCLARPTHASDRSALQSLLTKEAISKSVTAFRVCSELGVVAPDPYVKQSTAHHAEMASAIAVLRRTTGLRPPPQHDLPQLSGNSFWVRLPALRPLLDAGLDTETFLESRSAINRELAEAITAIIPEVVRDAGFSALKLSALLEGAASPQSQ